MSKIIYRWRCNYKPDKTELQAKGISSMIKDRFKQGLIARYGDGVPSAIDIFVTDEDFEKANEIVNAITKK